MEEICLLHQLMGPFTSGISVHSPPLRFVRTNVTAILGKDIEEGGVVSRTRDLVRLDMRVQSLTLSLDGTLLCSEYQKHPQKKGHNRSHHALKRVSAPLTHKDSTRSIREEVERSDAAREERMWVAKHAQLSVWPTGNVEHARVQMPSESVRVMIVVNGGLKGRRGLPSVLVCGCDDGSIVVYEWPLDQPSLKAATQVRAFAS